MAQQPKKLEREARCQQTKARNAARREYREKHPTAPAHVWRHRWPLPESA